MKGKILIGFPLILGVLLFLYAASANPVPTNVPYFSMTVEDMEAWIGDTDVHFEGIYHFGFGIDEGFEGCWLDEDCRERDEKCVDERCVPDTARECNDDGGCNREEICFKKICVSTGTDMYFPMPPDAKDIEVFYTENDILRPIDRDSLRPIDWSYVNNSYIADYQEVIPALPPEYKIWPTIRWHLVLGEPKEFSVVVKYNHSLLQIGGNKVWLYSLGTGNYRGWHPPLIENFSGKPYIHVMMKVNYNTERYEIVTYYPKDLEYNGWLFEGGCSDSFLCNYIPEKDFILVLRNKDTKLIPGDEFIVNSFITGQQTSPDVATDWSGNSLIVWDSLMQDGDLYGIYGQRMDSDGQKTGDEFIINTETRGSQRTPAVAMNRKGEAVVAWEGQDGNGSGIISQRFDNEGNRIGGEFILNNNKPYTQYNPDVAMDREGRIYAVWTAAGPDLDDNVYGAIILPNGSCIGLDDKPGNDFRVNNHTKGHQGAARIVADEDGDFAIVWQSFEQDGSNLGVYMKACRREWQRWECSYGDYRVNNYTQSSQSNPDIALLADGSYLVAWQSRFQDGSMDGVYYNIISEDSIFEWRPWRSGDEYPDIQANSNTEGSQKNPRVSVSWLGEAIVTWESDKVGDKSYWDIFGQRIDSNGNSIGKEFQINSYTKFPQSLAVPFYMANGDLMAVWQSETQDGSSHGIAARKFTYYIDSDGDGLQDIEDNCAFAENPDQRDSDSNGVGDACEPYLRGDANNDSKTDIADAVFILYYLFGSGERPLCEMAADINGDNNVDIADAIYLLQYLFGGGPAPVSKAPDC